MVLAVDEGFQRDVLRQQRLQRFVQISFDFRVNTVAFLFDAVVGADTYRLTIRTDGNDAHVSVAEAAGDQFTNLFGLYLLFELYLEVTSTGEVDALAQAAC